MRQRYGVAIGILIGLPLLALTLTGRGQDPPIRAGIAAGVVPTPFRGFVVADPRFPPVVAPDGKMERDPRDRTGKIHSFVTEFGLSPVVVVFTRSDPKAVTDETGLGKLVQAIDRILPKYRPDKLNAMVVFLRTAAGEKAVQLIDNNKVETQVAADKEYPDDEERDRHVQAIRDWISALKVMNVPVVLAPETSQAAKAWGIDDNDDVVVVVYTRLRLVAPPWKFPNRDAITDTHIAEIQKAIQAAIAPIR